MGCGCLVVLLGSAFPRLALVFTWIFTDRVDVVFDGWVLPLVGLLFLPYTTFFFVLAYVPIVGVTGIGWFFVLFGFFLDVSSYAGSGPHRHAALPLGVAHRPGPLSARGGTGRASGRAAQSLEEVDVLGEVAVAEELVVDARPCRGAESVGEPAVVQQAGHRRGERIEVGRDRRSAGRRVRRRSGPGSRRRDWR